MTRFTTFITVLLLACVLAVSSLGCSSYWSQIKKDPVTQVQGVISLLDTVITVSTVIFGEAKPLLPDAKRDSIQQRFSHAVLAVEASKRALRDGLEAAKAASNASPDLLGVMTNAMKAADDLRALVREVQAMVKMDAAPGSVAAEPSEPDDLDAAIEALGRARI